jgi:hypothetical protein
MGSSLRRTALAVPVVALMWTAGAAQASPAAPSSGVVTTVNGFRNFQLGGLPAELCPDPNSPCQNIAAEPAIRADNFGNFFASSENGIGSGTEAWKSIDGGRSYVHLPSPNELSSGSPPLSTAGGDTDLATAPVKNATGSYNVYVASLELSSVDVSTSPDGGHTWAQNPVASNVKGDDREWAAADGQSKICISYHDLAGGGIHVDCSYDAGTTFTQTGEAIDTTHAPFLATNNAIGNMMIDQNSSPSTVNNDIVYQSFSGIADATEIPCATLGTCGYHVVYMGVSTDGGKTFTDHVVYNNPTNTVAYGHQFVNVSVDKAGNVYAFYSDNHNLYYSYSTDHGTTWNGPHLVNKPPSNTAIFPWSATGAAGHVDVVWYGTSYFDGVNPPDTYPISAQWFVYFAQNLHATSPTSSWSQVKASPVVHLGGVCEGGISCTAPANRDLFDDFGIAVRPTTGLASIVYSDDQFNQYNPAFASTSNCTQALNNTSSCDHTSIATQVSGSSVGGGGGGGCHEGDGAGHVSGTKGGTASFTMDEDGCEDHDRQHVDASDPSSGHDFHSTQIADVVFNDALHSVTVYGKGTDGGTPVTFVATAVDRGATALDTFAITLSDGYTNAGHLLDGSIILSPAGASTLATGASPLVLRGALP